MPKLKHEQARRGHVSAEYRAWIEMRRRAGRTTRGAGYLNVRVCLEWQTSFESFFAYIGPRPGSDYSVDRFPDPFGNYEPGNVRWATRIEQSRNRRTARLVTINGVTRCLQEWSEHTGLSVQMLWRRLNKGWPESLLLEPPFKPGKTFLPLRKPKAMPTKTGA